MITKIALALVFSFILLSCDNGKVKKTTEIVSKVDPAHRVESDSIELNNGARWKVVPEMLVDIRNMEADINRFSGSRHNELKEFTNFAAGLQINIDQLTSNCTMDGKAHDELHKWLLPYIDLVDKLNSTETTEAATHTLEEIKTSFKTFNQYFE